MLLKLLVLVIISGVVGALIGNMQRKSVEGYRSGYYKVGMAHQFMPGTMSCPDSGTINCNDCQTPKSCYSY